MAQTSKTTFSNAAIDLVYICERVGITKANLGQRKEDFKQVVREYFKATPEFRKDSKQSVLKAISALK